MNLYRVTHLISNKVSKKEGKILLLIFAKTEKEALDLTFEKIAKYRLYDLVDNGETIEQLKPHKDDKIKNEKVSRIKVSVIEY